MHISRPASFTQGVVYFPSTPREKENIRGDAESQLPPAQPEAKMHRATRYTNITRFDTRIDASYTNNHDLYSTLYSSKHYP